MARRYDPFPSYPARGGRVELGLPPPPRGVLAIDGPAALDWERLLAALPGRPVVDVRMFHPPWGEVERRAAGGAADDPVFSACGTAPWPTSSTSCRVSMRGRSSGPGSALVAHDELWYADVPKRLALAAVARIAARRRTSASPRARAARPQGARDEHCGVRVAVRGAGGSRDRGAGPAAGPAGAAGDRPAWRREHRDGAPVRVGLVTMALGDDGALLRAAADAGVLDGLVVAGFGAGHVPPGVAGIMYELASRMPVVIASRTGAWTVLEGTYGWVGSEIDLTSRDVISAGFLDPPKARLLLHLLLSRGATRADVVAAFAAAGA